MSRTWVNKRNDKSGLQWWYRHEDDVLRIYIPGTDHPDDWKHHAQIELVEAANGIVVTRADLALAAEIARFCLDHDLPVKIGGHSWGGAIAALVVWILRTRKRVAWGYLYAPKQAGNRRFVKAISPYVFVYRRRGDLIPLIMFWLARYKMISFGKLTWPWKAHLPSSYNKQRTADGFS